MAPSAGLGEVEHDTLDRIEGRRAVAPQIRPMRLAVARLEHRHRGLVGVQHRSAEQCGLQRLDQRLQLDAAGTDPLRQRGARQAHPGAFEDRLLPVQRQMVGIFGHQHLGQQPGGGQPLVDDVRRHRRLHQDLALRAHPLAADVALDGEDAGHVVQLLGHVLADALHRAAAAAGGAVGFVADLAARQVRRQRLALRLFLRSRRRLRGGPLARQLVAQRLQIGVDRLLQEAFLLGVERFAVSLTAGGEPQPLEHRHLVRELVDGGLLEHQLPLLRLQ